MIERIPQERGVKGKVWRGIDRLLRDPDIGYHYRIPDIVDEGMIHPDGVAMHLSGSKNDLQVVLSVDRRSVDMNLLAPDQTRIRISENTMSGKTQTDISQRVITLHPGVKHQEARVFSLLASIGRLWWHEDLQKHTTYQQSQHLLAAQLWLLQAYGDIGSQDEDEGNAWRVVVEEEVAAQEWVFQQHRQLLHTGINLFPQQTTVHQLAELANSRHFLRTGLQVDIDPAKTAYHLNLPMTLSDARIGQIMRGRA